MKRNLNNNERGIALLFVLFALLLLTAIAAGLMFMTSTETNINANYGSAQVSYFAARSGNEEVKSRMQVTAVNSLDPLLPTTMPGNPNGVLYVVNQTPGDAAVTPWTVNSAYMDDQLCQDWGGTALGMPAIPGLLQRPLGQRCDTLPNVGGWYRNPAPVSTGPGAGTTSALSYKWTRVTLKANASVDGAMVDGSAAPSITAGNQVCWDGGNQQVLTAASCDKMAPAMTQVYMLTSLAVSRTGSRRMTQTEVAKNLMPPIPSALTLDGDKARTTFGTPNSNNFGISGQDACSARLLPAIGTVTDQDDAGVEADLFRPNMFTGAGSTPSVQNLNNPPRVPPALLGLTTVGDIKNLVANVTSMADHIYNMPAVIPGGALGTPGNDATAQITIINGDFGGPCDGNGILLITGNAICGGNTKFDGLMLFIGKGNVQWNGGGNGQINGAVFIANLFDDAGRPLPDMSVPGLPTFDWNGGGTNFIQYNSCKILNGFRNAPYRMLSMREVTY